MNSGKFIYEIRKQCNLGLKVVEDPKVLKRVDEEISEAMAFIVHANGKEYNPIWGEDPFIDSDFPLSKEELEKCVSGEFEEGAVPRLLNEFRAFCKAQDLSDPDYKKLINLCEEKVNNSLSILKQG